MWEFVAFVLTALVLLLIGPTSSFADLGAADSPIAWGIVAIVAGRIAVVYGFLGGLRLLARMPLGWLHVVFWSGLRGAVAFALALALPLDVPDRELLQGTIFGIVLFTLLVQGASARRVIAWSGLEVGQASRNAKMADQAEALE